MSLFKSIATFGGWTLISRITGFFRDMVMANYLGAGAVSEAFFVAFKLSLLNTCGAKHFFACFSQPVCRGGFYQRFRTDFFAKAGWRRQGAGDKICGRGNFGAGVQPRAFCVADGNRYALGGGGFGAGVCR